MARRSSPGFLFNQERDRILNIVHATQIPTHAHWATQLANLTRTAWSSSDGQCHFPYRPLTEAHEWEHAVRDAWNEARMHSWVLVDERGHFQAHAALVQKNGYWELGRWVALPNAPKGAVTKLCEVAMEFVHAHNLRVQVECTQAHTASQKICVRLGLRFAGIGILGEIEGVTWDIIYFDSLPGTPFTPRAGLLADPLDHPVRCEASHRARLREISTILTTDCGEELPPRRFHTLPHLVDPIRSIVSLNT